MTTIRDVQRYQAPGTLYVKRPAAVTPMNRTELMTAGPYERQQLRSAAQRLQRRGEIQIVRREVWNPEAERWVMVVRRLRPAWHRKAWIAGGIVGTLLALFGTGWWLLATLSLAALVGLLAAVLVGFLLLVRMTGKAQGSSKRVIEVITKVSIG